MAVVLIYPHTNAPGPPHSVPGHPTFFPEGMCAGYAIDWAKRFLQGKELSDTKPDHIAANYSTWLYWEDRRTMDVLDAIEKQVANHGLRITRRETRMQAGGSTSLFVVTERAAENAPDGVVWLLGMGGHMVAYGKLSGAYYYFDANRGLKMCSDTGEIFDLLIEDPVVANEMSAATHYALLVELKP